MEIREDGLQGAAIIRLLQEHLDHMHAVSPPESCHALDLDGLRAPEITFWSAWDGEVLLGCGALKALDRLSGEIKSMRTVSEHRGRGIAAGLLEHIIREGRRRAYDRLSLETGSMIDFVPARALYERYNFTYCGPFGDYREDPNSVFMTLSL